MLVLLFLHIFRLKIFTFLVSIYKELLEPTFSDSLIVLNNLGGVFGCSVITEFISLIFGF